MGYTIVQEAGIYVIDFLSEFSKAYYYTPMENHS